MLWIKNFLLSPVFGSSCEYVQLSQKCETCWPSVSGTKDSCEVCYPLLKLHTNHTPAWKIRSDHTHVHTLPVV